MSWTNEETLWYHHLRGLNQRRIDGDVISGTVEKIDASIELDPRQRVFDYSPAFKTDVELAEAQLAWYATMNRRITGSPFEGKGQWSHVKPTKSGFTNSNYGWCVYSPDNGDGEKSQFDFAIDSLIEKKHSRQAVIFYNRPGMHVDWKFDGMSDFTCTLDTHLFIRNDKLIYIVHQRSCDLFLGFFYDYYHHTAVYADALEKLRAKYDVGYGSILYHIDSLHVYERDFDTLEHIIKTFDFQR